jgi:acyl-CoA thioesterase FadM
LSHFISFVRIPALAIRQLVLPLSPASALGEEKLAMRVWPQDIDFNFHLNNARYLSLMDYGRMHLLARNGLLGPMLRNRWKPLVGAVWITYRRSLPLFARFELKSRLVSWDERWFYFEQTFTGRDGLSAVSWVKAVLRDTQGNVTPQKVIDLVAPGLKSPALPEAFAGWNEITREQLKSSL